MTPRQLSFLGLTKQGFHRVNYWEWGDPHNSNVVVCVHGLTRNGRDFDWLARALAARYRVICPDVAGRGQSERLRDWHDYQYPQYVQDMVALLARANVERVKWVGTSMGGIIGMAIAAQPGNPIERLVLNDVGVVIPGAALARISEYVGRDPEFESMDAYVAFIRSISPFGQLTDAQWLHLAETGADVLPNGKIRSRYDPGIGEAYRFAAQQLGGYKDIDLSMYWNHVTCPTLIIRGESSDLLTQETLKRMCEKPNVRSIEVPNAAHAPALIAGEQIKIVADFLGAGE